MSALRCSSCGIDWPFDLADYGKCPKCLGATDHIGDATGMAHEDAQSAARHHEFDRFYEKWEADKAAVLATLEAAAAAAGAP